MATWTASTAIPAGGLITSGWINNVSGMINFLGASGTGAKDFFFARQTTAQALSSAVGRGTANRINWDTEDIDAANGHGTATNVYMGYTAQATGKYALQVGVPMTAGGASTDLITISFYKGTGGTASTELNGGRFVFPNRSTTDTAHYITPIYYATVTAGEVIDVRVATSFNGTTVASTATNTQPTFSLQWVGA